MVPPTRKAKKGIGLKLSTLLSPLTARSSNSVRPPPWSDDDDDDDSDSSDYESSIIRKKKKNKDIVFTRSNNRNGGIGGNRKQKNKKKQRYHSDGSSYYSYSEGSLSALSEEDAYTSTSDNTDEYVSPLSHHHSGKHHHRHRRQQRQQRDSDKRRRRRKRRESWPSSSSSGSVLSEYIGHSDDYVLTRGELNELSTKTLRKRCHRAGIDVNEARNKGDLVQALCNHYRTRSSRKSRDHATVRAAADSPSRSRRKQGERTEEGAGLDDETGQMIEILQEIIPFYGQGDHQSDAIVRDTIERLPEHALELPDASGNTILLLACQSGTYDLVPLLLSRGSDAGAQNNDGVASLHFACYTDFFSPEMAELLVDHGATADVFENQYGCSPLHWAAFAGHTDLCNLLCQAGGNPRTVDNNGCDAVEYSRQSGNEDCLQFLLSLADPRAPPAAPAAKAAAAAAEQAVDNNEDGAWEEHIDNESGRKCFRNTATAQALWEDEYKDLILNAPAGPMDEQSTLVAGGNKIDDEDALVIVPTRASTEVTPLSPAIATEANNTISSSTFEERMVALQSKMENQFLQQLSKIEGRISEQQLQQQHIELQQQHATAATASSEGPSESLIEMTSKVVQLQADIGGKDLEILSLKRDVSSLEAKLAMGIEQQQQRPSFRSRDAGVGDGNISELHREESSHDMKIDIATVEDELEMTSRRLKLAKEQSLELETQLRLSKQELLAAQDKQALAEQQVATAEDTLAKERLAKDDILRLLEQTKQGTQVGQEISQSIKEEKTRDKETIARLELNLKSMELVKADEMAVFQSQLNHKEKKLADESLNITHLNEEMEEMRRSIASERDRLDVARREHSTELQQLRDASTNEMAKLEEELAKSYGGDKEELQRQLNEERLSKMECIVLRNDAIEAKEEAVKRMNVAEDRLEKVGVFVTKAKELTGANERLHRALQDETEKRKTLHNKLEDLKGRIRVYVRIRPLSTSETKRQCQSALIKEDKRTCVMNADPDKGTDPKSWEFDQVFCGSSENGNSQEDVFRDTSLLITSAVDGFNVCLFAYGQTGSGKSHTMFGPGAVSYDTPNGDSGLAPRAAEELFRVLQEKAASCHVEVQVCMFELYNDSLRDLLVSSREDEDGLPVGGKPLKIKLAQHSETGMVEVEGAIKATATDASELLRLFERGSQSRATASTEMNADSSRSHLIASIVTTLTNKRTGKQLRGKLTLCDLAGSERVSKSGATGDQLKEAQSINKSLSALGDVISALTSGSRHVPYRNHPLTMLMSDSLGGSAKTLMFVCCSPADYNRSESSTSLDFARRCKKVTNDLGNSDQAIRKLKAELARVKSKQHRSNQEDVPSAKRAIARRPGRPGH